MAGSDPRFNATKFRDAIKFAMRMGLPNSTSERVTFQWDVQREFPRQDSGGAPFDFSQAPVTSFQRPDVQVTCAVEFSSRPAGSRPTIMGEFDTSRMVVTVLDDEYTSVSDANRVHVHGADYKIQFWGPPIGLFDVTVYQAFCEAMDEA